MSRRRRNTLIDPIVLGLTPRLGARNGSSLKKYPTRKFTLFCLLFEDGELFAGPMTESPPLVWTKPPAGTQSLALTLHFWPVGAEPGRDLPEYRWLLWNIPAKARGLPQGNPARLGKTAGVRGDYTSPRTRTGAEYLYIITLYALSRTPWSLGARGDAGVDWATFMAAIKDTTLATAELDFFR